MLLHRTRGTRSVGRDELPQRADAFAGGRWQELFLGSGHLTNKSRPRDLAKGEEFQVQQERGQVSRARQELTGAALDPKTSETLREFHKRRPQVQCLVCGPHLQVVHQDQEGARMR